MTKRWVCLLSLLLLASAALAAPPQGSALSPTPAASSAAAFLDSLRMPGATLPAAASCPANFCTSQQKYQCHVVTCHNHGIGLLCDSSTCTSECICGSVPPP